MNGATIPYAEWFESLNIPTCIRRVMYTSRGQERRFFYDLAEDVNSALYTEQNLQDLLDRVRDAFNGVPES